LRRYSCAYFFHIGYNGFNYQGWQKLPGTKDVQFIIEILKTLSANGQLKIGETPVTGNQVIAANTIDNLAYTATPTFSGNDSWYWNTFDGYSYAATDAKVTIVVPIVTDISETSGPEILVSQPCFLDGAGGTCCR
jgi:hypothetical protein